MTLIAYKKYKPRADAQTVIDRANHIIEEMAAQGYKLTIRQLFYQFVRRNWFPNAERSYKKLIRILTDARNGGHVSWTALEDRGRDTKGGGYQMTDKGSLLDGIEAGISVDPWLDQEWYVECFVEKQALESVVGKICNQWQIRYTACKGYLSSTEAWNTGNRFAEAASRGKKCRLIHLGDHDPSGMDMTRDNTKRLNLYSELPEGIDVQRVALNMDQLEEHKPPPQPAKKSDSRHAKYVKAHGSSSWELDALEPILLHELIHGSIRECLDMTVWDKSMALEKTLKADAKQLYERKDELFALLKRDVDILSTLDSRVLQQDEDLEDMAGICHGLKKTVAGNADHLAKVLSKAGEVLSPQLQADLTEAHLNIDAKTDELHDLKEGLAKHAKKVKGWRENSG